VHFETRLIFRSAALINASDLHSAMTTCLKHNFNMLAATH